MRAHVQALQRREPGRVVERTQERARAGGGVAYSVQHPLTVLAILGRKHLRYFVSKNNVLAGLKRLRCSEVPNNSVFIPSSTAARC